MFAIGEFARLSRVTVKALRYWDEAGLLKPARVDRTTGYRYYTAEQLSRLNRILVLKELGFTLEQIGKMVEAGISGAELKGMLRMRQMEQQLKIQEEASRLAAIQQMIEEIQNEGMPLDVVVKESTPKYVVSTRGNLKSYPEISRLYPVVYSQLGAKAFGGVPIAIWHSPDMNDEIDAEAGVLFDEPLAVTGALQCYRMEPVEVASYIHQGSFIQFKGIYDRLMRWLEASQWEPAGPCREIYLKIGNPVRQDDESYVTEIQVPVRKAA